MKINKSIIIVFLISILCLNLSGQTPDIPIQVINSAGGSGVTSNNIHIDYNIGEVSIATIGSSSIITQGFLQPSFAIARFRVDKTSSDISCFKKKDGKIHLTYQNAASNATISTLWWSSVYGYSTCTNNNCVNFDTLSPGTYIVKVIYDDGIGLADTLPADTFKIADNTGHCPINIYNIVTPNGDGQNDVFFIENIEEYDNVVYIYSRWGQVLAEIPKYNNTNNYWAGTVFNGNTNDATKNQNLPSGTYFYIIDLKDGSRLIKGFIELVRQ